MNHTILETQTLTKTFRSQEAVKNICRVCRNCRDPSKRHADVFCSVSVPWEPGGGDGAAAGLVCLAGAILPDASADYGNLPDAASKYGHILRHSRLGFLEVLFLPDPAGHCLQADVQRDRGASQRASGKTRRDDILAGTTGYKRYIAWDRRVRNMASCLLVRWKEII